MIAKKKDKRYDVVKVMIEAKEIKTFKQIFKYLPKSILAKSLGSNNTRTTRLINNPGDFKFSEVLFIASLFGVPYQVLADMMEKAVKELKAKAERKVAKKNTNIKNVSG